MHFSHFPSELHISGAVNLGHHPAIFQCQVRAKTLLFIFIPFFKYLSLEIERWWEDFKPQYRMRPTWVQAIGPALVMLIPLGQRTTNTELIRTITLASREIFK